MRTRSFIGLILLIAVLMVVSIPALLQPASAGLETALVKAGLLEDQQKAFEQARKIDASQSDAKVTNSMMLKGHELNEETGDLRDTVSVEKRNSNEHGRLVDGDRRVLLPGQLVDQDAYTTPPITGEDGMVLDNTGCPVVQEDANLSTLFEDADTKAKFQEKADAADDPAACSKTLNDRLDADQNKTATLLPGDKRRMTQQIRGTSNRMLMDAYMDELYAAFFGRSTADTADAAAALREQLAAD